jgi:4'-phosphopantetheinyl transferase
MTEVFYQEIDLDIPDGEMELLARKLSPEKQIRYHNLRLKTDRLTLVTGDRLIREVLAAKCSCDPGEIRFGFNRHNKPFPTNPGHPFFNLSHSGKYVIAAFSSCEVGIDLEEIRPVQEISSKAQIFMSDTEFSRFSKLTPKEKHTFFYRLWTAKESFIKNTGRGIYERLTSITIDIDVSPFHLCKDGERLSGYHFQEILLDPGYAACICLNTCLPQTIRISRRIRSNMEING